MQVQCGINIEMSTGIVPYRRKFVEKYNMAIELKLPRDIVALYRQVWMSFEKTIAANALIITYNLTLNFQFITLQYLGK